MTTPYSPETATALANGSTTRGYVETSSYVGWDTGLALYNHRAIEERAQYLALDQRRNMARLRAELRTALNIASKGTLKILACGDSITAGAGSSDSSGLTNQGGYPGWMADLLDRQNIKGVISYNAHSGWSLGNISSGMAAALSASTPDIVTIHIGTNDAGGDLTNYGANYTALLNQILAFTPTVKGIACALIPIAQQVSAGYQSAMQQINSIVTGVVQQMNNPRVVLADLTACHEALWNTNPAWTDSPPGRWTLDGMHPLDAACLKTAEAFLKAAAPWTPGYQP